MHQAWEMQHDYEKRVQALIEAVKNIQTKWARASFTGGYADSIRQLREFESYKSTTKRGWIAERRELDTLLGNIQTKLKTYNLRPYTPPAGLTLEELAKTWEELITTEARRKRSITASIRDIKDNLRKTYADAANQLAQDLTLISQAIASLSGELEQQLDTTNQLITQHDSLKHKLGEIEKLNKDCEEANIEDNE
jgi:hypothetical protein